MERPNRFIAYVELSGKLEKVHVKNTGRCRELLTKGVHVYLEESEKEERKTKYDLVAVEKGNRLINMDSQAPNKAVQEWLLTKELFPDLVNVKPETTYQKSRFDFYIECKAKKIFMEVKGVTLERDGVVSFPDAPSERAVKHVEELIKARQEGYEAYVLFVVQMEDVTSFVPNQKMHPEFAAALQKANQAGVHILAYECKVTPDEMTIDKSIPVKLDKSEEGRESMADLLLSWYDKNRRVLPWREDCNPYKIWVSEIMLQQTRVEAVKPYFERFIHTLPNVEALAKADEEILLKLWEGLGYYNRVRNMQKAAKQVMTDFHGKMPEEKEQLLTLSGIGNYTAGAIASIAFGKQEPAVDGNVLRVMTRLTQDKADIGSQKVKSKIEALVKKEIPKERAGDFTQAMIEIGALVCVPNGNPHCEECPFSKRCLAHRNHCELEIPVKAAKKARKLEEKTVLILMDGEKVALHKRANKGLLAGLYEFPMLDGFENKKAVLKYCEEVGLTPLYIKKLSDAKHIFSHVEWRMKGYVVRVDELHLGENQKSACKRKEKDWIFVEPKNAEDKYAIPSAFATYTRYLNIWHGNGKLR